MNPVSQSTHGGQAAELCPLCGGPNACRMCDIGTHKGPCWCERVEVPAELVAKVPEPALAKVCICHKCVSEHLRARGRILAPVRGDTYLTPDGRLVFTAEYHLRRGYCCGSGCRHCPYDAEGRPQTWLP